MTTAWRSIIVDSLGSQESPSAEAGPTALDVTKTISRLTSGTDGTQDLYTLADAQADQIKIIYLIAGTDTIRITPTNLLNGTYIELLAIGDYVVLEFTGIEWEVIYLGRSAELT